MGSRASRPSAGTDNGHSERPPETPPVALNSSKSGKTHGSGAARVNPSDADLRSYEDACRSDPDLEDFDSTLQLRTSRAIHSIAAGVEVRSLSLDSLREVTECLLEMNQEVVKVILKNKKDVWKNVELSDLVDDYFENSLLTLDFCAALDACLKRAGHIESIVNVALGTFEEERYAQNNDYSRTLDELRKFREAADPFTAEFFRVFSSVYSKQVSTLEKLQLKKRKMDEKLGKLKVWRRVSNVIFVVTFASVLICSVVAAAVAAPPVVTALAAAAAVPLGSTGRWLSSLWKNCERDLKSQKEIVNAMQIGAFVVIKDMDSIRVQVDRFQIELEAMLGSAGYAAAAEESAAATAVVELRKKVDEFVRIIEELGKYADKCTHETRMARTVILRRIINHPPHRGSTLENV
ncbi:hypothetical protein M569_16405 [Genlisea aurea]|uniref:Uncharacterized protein n=1 Tax=Genlisea aurea TaxID=192259 RepID=S8D6Z7_9LAMI|nr:hypothetical protein M569_16405 [Genlisea aurea]